MRRIGHLSTATASCCIERINEMLTGCESLPACDQTPATPAGSAGPRPHQRESATPAGTAVPKDPDGAFEGVVVSGDNTIFAIHSPGHISLIVRTPDGPVLFTGDIC